MNRCTINIPSSKAGLKKRVGVAVNCVVRGVLLCAAVGG